MEDKKICFVITPIGDDNTPIRRHIDGIIDQAIIPAISEKFQVKVAHREYEIGSINDKVIQSIYNSDLVIANLTGLNPNVMFEIAIRYSFGKPAIVIAEKGTKLPFDIVDENTIFYINDPAGAADLKDTIRKFMEKINWEKHEYGPVFSAIRNAAVVNTIETGISGEENKNAFSFLVEKISKIENEIQGMRFYRNQPDNLTIIARKSAKAIANSLYEKENDQSDATIYNALKSTVDDFFSTYGNESGDVLINELKKELKNNELFTQNTRSRFMNILGKIQNSF